MTKEEELIQKLKDLQDERDLEGRHITADELLLDYIGSDAVREAFDAIDKWYA